MNEQFSTWRCALGVWSALSKQQNSYSIKSGHTEKRLTQTTVALIRYTPGDDDVDVERGACEEKPE